MKALMLKNLKIVSDILELDFCGDGYNFPNIMKNVSPSNTKSFIEDFVKKNIDFSEGLLIERGFNSEKFEKISNVYSSLKDKFWNSSCGRGISFNYKENNSEDYIQVFFQK